MPSSSVIEAQGITRRFKDLVAVDQLALNVPEGCVYGFLGPNGAGKTTTIRMLLGLIRPDQGEIFLFGEKFDRRKWALLSKVGAMVESPSLYPHLTGRENLEVTRRLLDVPRTRIDQVLEIVRLTDAAHRQVKGYSTGMRQRLGLALALMNEPQVLILDEPTNGLDPGGIQDMRELIRTLPETQNVTVFLSSHLLHEVELIASHIGVINRGKLLFQGTLESLRELCPPTLHIQSEQLSEIQQALSLAGWSTRITGRPDVEVDIDGPAELGKINRYLVEHGLDMFQTQIMQSSLEELFFQLTQKPA